MGLPEGLRDRLDTKFFAEGPGGLEQTAELLGRVNGEELPVLLIGDRHTRRAAGERLGELLSRAGISWEELVLEDEGPAPVSPGYERVEALRDRIRREGRFPLAVGSGTINDLVKRAAFEAGTPYLCAATASSMDGYASFGASLVKDGYKTTLPCTPPAAIVADTEILRGAPYDMTASGYGDLYAKRASGVDWILADRLGIEPVHGEAWGLVQGDLFRWTASPEKLKGGDAGAFSGLFTGLTMSGIAMQIYHDSRPASGAEHLISHVWEMAHLSSPGGIPLSHGFKVAMGTALSAGLMERLYFSDPRRLSVEAALAKRESWASREAAVRRLFPDPLIANQALEASRAKWPSEKALAARLENLIPLLPELGKVLDERLGSRDQVVSDLQKAGCPVFPADFGLSPREVQETLLKAQMIRKRYTVLDAAYELGLLEELSLEL
jgi:glycerol-1-phosphate dehydrogenase [NAD(P)+]